MRVTRRVRPSRVGCGATIARRRLYAAARTASVPESQAPNLPRMALTISPDGRIFPLDLVPQIDEVAAGYDASSERAPANVRGR
jgi:hypothetical protein